MTLSASLSLHFLQTRILERLATPAARKSALALPSSADVLRAHVEEGHA